MTHQHPALGSLPDLLDHVEVASGWLDGQCDDGNHYLWTDPHTGHQAHDEHPSAFMVHHTAGTSASPPHHRTSKANAWIGLKRGDRLYQSGGGVPTIYLASAGPARISAGYGYRPGAWDYTFKGKRAPVHAGGPDGSTALNRYAFSVEVVHAGDGSAIDPNVWQQVVNLGHALEELLGLSESTIGHAGWSRRKIDPRWSVGLPNDGADCIIDIQEAISEQVVTIPPPVSPVEHDWGRDMRYVQEGDFGFEVEYWQVRIVEAVTGVRFAGGSTRTFVEAHAPSLSFKHWDDALTVYLSGWTGRNSYGVGPNERVLLENARPS